MSNLTDFEKEHVWHPYASLTAPIPVINVVKTEGTDLILEDGRRITDGMSSWWSCCHGYGNQHIIEAMTKQLHTMSHVMFAGISHNPATELAKMLVELTPDSLDYVFFADSGSVAVEIALKMAFQYQSALHPKRTKFMTMCGGYHGDTLGAMSVTDPAGGINTFYQNYIPPQVFLPRPAIKFNEPWQAEETTRLEAYFAQHQAEVAAFIIEPIVQGAGGMYFYHPNYLREIRRLCTKYDIIFIADEIATGFGRTGKMFACEYAEVVPDIMTLGKALTAGFMTLSAVMCNKKVRDGISASPSQVMMHGPTFMANPLACACAKASLEVLQSYPVLEKVAHICDMLASLEALQNLPAVKEVRVLGAIGVVELYDHVQTAKWQQFFVNEGVWLRPFGNIIYIYPPFIMSDADLQKCIRAVSKLVHTF